MKATKPAPSLLLAALMIGSCLAGCDSGRGRAADRDMPSPTQVADSAALVTAPEPTPLPTAAPESAETAERDEAASDEDLRAKGLTRSPKPTSLCWQDYCPCDRSDPDYGGADYGACQQLKLGNLDDQLMAGAAAARDARRQLREFNEAN